MFEWRRLYVFSSYERNYNKPKAKRNITFVFCFGNAATATLNEVVSGKNWVSYFTFSRFQTASVY